MELHQVKFYFALLNKKGIYYMKNEAPGIFGEEQVAKSQVSSWTGKNMAVFLI